MAEPKTKKTEESVEKFLDKIPDDARREDCYAIARMMEDATGEKPKLWGTSLVGFGSYRYKGASGREGDWPLTAFSPRKNELSLYIMTGFGNYQDLMEKLGKHSTGKGCLYIKRLSDVHVPTLKKLIRESVKEMKKKTAKKSS